MARKTENPRIVASTLGALAMIDIRHGRLDDAVAKLHESLLIHAETGDRLDTAVDVCRAAHVLAARGRTAVAARMLAAFDNVRPQVGVRAGWMAELNARTAEAIARDLGDDAATQAAEEARTLELDDAVALAVAELASV